MAKIPVFAGLGSDVVFNDATHQQAMHDIQPPRGQVLLELCHKIFIEEVSHASQSTQTSFDIDLGDFETPMNMIRPHQKYHHHPIIQHSTLSLVQLLRYQCCNSADPQSASQKIIATTGLCVGLFAAVVVATTKDAVQYLARAKECFRINVLLGIAIERLREKDKPFQSKFPSSLIIAGIAEEDMSKLISVQMASKVGQTQEKVAVQHDLISIEFANTDLHQFNQHEDKCHH